MQSLKNRKTIFEKPETLCFSQFIFDTFINRFMTSKISIKVVNLAQWSERSMDKIKQEGKKRICPDCSSEDIEYENGELFCKKCGLVID